MGGRDRLRDGPAAVRADAHAAGLAFNTQLANRMGLLRAFAQSTPTRHRSDPRVIHTHMSCEPSLYICM